MNTLSNKNSQSLIEQIRNYFLEHPDAADSIEGICDWWLQGKVNEFEKVQEAINELISDGFLVEKLSESGEGKIYSLNKK